MEPRAAVLCVARKLIYLKKDVSSFSAQAQHGPQAAAAPDLRERQVWLSRLVQGPTVHGFVG